MELSKKNRDAITQLAQSSDAQKLRELLQRQSGEVSQAAKAAAAERAKASLADLEGKASTTWLVYFTVRIYVAPFTRRWG